MVSSRRETCEQRLLGPDLWLALQGVHKRPPQIYRPKGGVCEHYSGRGRIGRSGPILKAPSGPLKYSESIHHWVKVLRLMGEA